MKINKRRDLVFWVSHNGSIGRQASVSESVGWLWPLPASQNFPVYPSGQAQRKRRFPFMQEPPFWQGLGMQGDAGTDAEDINNIIVCNSRALWSVMTSEQIWVWGLEQNKALNVMLTWLAVKALVGRFALALIKWMFVQVDDTVTVATTDVLANISSWTLKKNTHTHSHAWP